MTNPKTLKDIQKTSVFSGVYPVKEMLVDTGDLRAEAIKWIKDLEEYGYLGEEYSQNELEGIYCKSKPAIFWIKHFFNISEEDLK